MSVTAAQVTASGADFQRVFDRMTAAECRALLVDGLGISNTICTPPSYLTAEGALSCIVWNNGGGTLSGSAPVHIWTATGLSSSTPNHRAHLLYDLMSAYWTADPVVFLTNTGASYDRQIALIQDAEVTNLTPQITRIMVGSTPANMTTAIAAYPEITERDNIIMPIDVYYNSNYDGLGAKGQANLDPAYVAAYLITQPAGRRYIYAGRHTNYVNPSDVGCLLGIPVTSGAGNGRYAFWDLEMTTANRSGLSMANYRTQIAASDSKLRVFVQAILAAGVSAYGSAAATTILDGLVFDIEHRKTFYDFQRGINGVSTGAAQNMLSPIAAKTVSSIDLGTMELTTSSAHGWTTGDAVLISAATTMPAGLLSGYPYYVNVSGGATKAKLYKRRADAITPGTAVVISSGGTGAITAQWVTETADEIFADSGWSTFRDSTFQPAGLDQTNVWDKCNLHVANTYTWYTQNFPFLYEAYMHKYYIDSLNVAVSVFTDYFPDLRVNCYDAGMMSTLYSWDLCNEQHGKPFGIGSTVAGGDTTYLYGATMTSDYRWNWRLSSDGSVDTLSGTANEKKWTYFAMDYSRHMAMARASTNTKTPWIAYDTLAGQYANWGTAGLWQEVVLHASLASSEINFYNEAATSLQHKNLAALLKERDAIALYEPGIVRGVYVPTLSPKYLYTKVWCGYRWVSRYTPNTTLSPTWAQVGSDVVITYGDATTTTISNATLTAYAGTLATLGFWVEQTTSAFDTGETTFANRFARTQASGVTLGRSAPASGSAVRSNTSSTQMSRV